MALTQIRKEQIASVDVDALDCSTELKTFLNSASSANLAAAVSDETGTGSLVFNDSPTLIAPALGTPASGVLTNATGLPMSTGMAAFSSADLSGKLSDESGTGLAVFNNGPTLITPALGTPASGILDNCTTASPTNPTDIANKEYVDALSAGLSWKESVKAATDSNITLSGDSQTIDGIAIGAGDRVLVKAQTDSEDNGIYVAAAGAWSRSLDMDEADEFSGSAVFVEQGTASGDQGYVCTNDGNITVGTTEVSWTQFTGTGAFNFRSGLTAAGNAVDVAFRTEIFPGSGLADGNIDGSFPVSFLEADSGGEDHFAGMSAPKAATNDDPGRQNYPVSVFLNGILLSSIKLASNASEATIEDFLAGTNVSTNNGDSLQLDCVILLSDSSSAFKLYLNQADILDDDLVTLSYAL